MKISGGSHDEFLASDVVALGEVALQVAKVAVGGEVEGELVAGGG